MREQAGLDAPPGDDGTGDWFSAQEPTGVGEAVLDALELAEDRVKVSRPDGRLRETWILVGLVPRHLSVDDGYGLSGVR